MQSRHLIIIGCALLIVAGGIALNRSKQPVPSTSAVAENPSSHSRGHSAGFSARAVTPCDPAARHGSFSSVSRSLRPASASAVTSARNPAPTPTASSRPATPTPPADRISGHTRFSRSSTEQPGSSAAPVGESPRSSFIAIDADAPGNTLSSSGQTVRVIAAETNHEGNTLNVEITPSPQSASAARRGFTLEEDHFRAKWGWQSYDQTQRTAFTASQETN